MGRAFQASLGMGAVATGICEGGHDTGDSSPCVTAIPGAAGGWSLAQLTAYNNSLNPGIAPLTPADLVAAGLLDAQAANALMTPGGGPFVNSPLPPVGKVSNGTNTYVPSGTPSLGMLQIAIVDSVTGANGILYAGNPYRLTITGGQPGAAVSVNVNGSVQSFGNADGQGNFVLTGTTPNSLATVQQTWTIGTASTGLQFTIVAPSTAANPTQSTTTTSTQPGTVDPTAGQTPVVAPVGATDILSELENTTVLGIPILYLGIGVLGIMFFAGSGHKGR